MDEDEQDNLRRSTNHKKKKRKSKKPSSMNTAEREVRDVQSKIATAGRDITSNPSAVTEGVVAMEPPTRAGSVQPTGTAEASPRASSDALAKSRVRRASSGAVARGTVAAVSSEPDTRADISFLEADIMAKNRAHPAFAATTGSQSGKTSGRSLQNSTSPALEARATAEQLAGIQSLERDVDAKIRARPSTSETLIYPASRKASLEVTRGVSGGEVVAAAVAGAAVAANGAAWSELSAAALPSAQKNWEDEDTKHPQDNETGDDGFGEANVYHRPSPPEATQQEPIQEPVYSLPSGFGEDEGDAGIEAFVAIDQIIDATGVALVMSDEEQDIQDKKRFRRYMLLSIGCLVIVTAVVITPIVVLFGKNLGSGPTNAPILAPTGSPTNAPTSSRLDDILDFARTISSPESVEDPNSPQYLAADWVANTDEVQAPMGSLQLTQRYTLAVFYFSTGGDDWEECNRLLTSCNVGFRWLTGSKSECLWHGIRCSTEDQHVSDIFIGHQLPFGNNLEGTLPTELSELSGMISIVLIQGKVGGTLPVEYGRLTNLITIFIQDMELTGTIPEELLNNTPKMSMLALGRNQFSGTIPTSLASLPVLRDLQLTGNKFTGTIPAQLGNLGSFMSKF